MNDRTPPSPLLFLDAVNGMQRAAIIKAAVELEVFTAIHEGHRTVDVLATRCGAATRGLRILCDCLAAMGFLIKSGSDYSLTSDSAAFLVQSSPGYLGDITKFLLSDEFKRAFDDFTGAVRHGGVAYSEKGNTAEESPAWVEFARAMMNLQRRPAMDMAQIIERPADAPLRVLDVAAGHGMYGIAVAKRFPNARITGLDWAPVVAFARRNAEDAGLDARYETIAGDAFKVDPGGPYDVILLPNFLHHFTLEECVTLLKRMNTALEEDGMILTLEHIPNEARTEPPHPLMFAAIMLATTPHGDAYTLSEYTSMFEQAGFASTRAHVPPDARGTILISTR